VSHANAKRTVPEAGRIALDLWYITYSQKNPGCVLQANAERTSPEAGSNPTAPVEEEEEEEEEANPKDKRTKPKAKSPKTSVPSTCVFVCVRVLHTCTCARVWVGWWGGGGATPRQLARAAKASTTNVSIQ